MPFERHTLRRITWFVLGASVLLTAIAFALGGLERGVGAGIGGAVAVLNWWGMRWIGERLLRANDKGRLVWGSLLAIKMAAVLGVVWAILATGLVDPLGFGIGMSALVVGILVGALHLAWSGAADTADEAPLGEES